MTEVPTQYRFARDRQTWDGELVGLERDVDGYLRLAPLPGPADGKAVSIPPSWSPEPSGIVAGPCGAVFVADTDHSRILFVDSLCDARAWLPGCASSAPFNLFDYPRGLAVSDGGLWVADTGNRRVVRLAYPALELDFELRGGFIEPTAVAVDGEKRVYVLDRAGKRVTRYDRMGNADFAYNAALVASGRIQAPLWLALDKDAQLFVSDGTANVVVCFEKDGAFVRALSSPHAIWRPGALVAGGGRLYVADQFAGGIDVYLSDGTWWCALPSFCGPVTALALTTNGNLLIKTDLHDTYIEFEAGQSIATNGVISCGPYDAGEQQEWFRAAADMLAPKGTSVTLEVVQWDAPTPAPGPGDWVSAAAFDTLLEPLVPSGPAPALRRFLWLRAILRSVDGTTTPVLRNLRAETLGEDYRVYLPEIYARSDAGTLFLFRLLALVKAEIGAVEERIDAMPQLLSPDFAPFSQLPWLARWLGLDLPRIATDAERRDLIKRAIELHRRRSTPAGIREFVEIHTGIRPSVIEAYEQRGTWVLDIASSLGFDTGLPVIDPLGMVVPDCFNPLKREVGCCDTTIGTSVVGEAGPLDVASIGTPLFGHTAHRFAVFVPAYRADDTALRAEVRRIIDAEKPAHTDYHLCLIAPELRVGFQAQVGVDTIVGGTSPAMRLDATRIGMETNLPGSLGHAGRVGQNISVGHTTVLG